MKIYVVIFKHFIIIIFDITKHSLPLKTKKNETNVDF